MSFTSQNYGVRKFKRMDKILFECLGLTMVVALVLGGGSYLFGSELMHIYTKSADVVACGMDIMLYTTVTYFLCGIMDLFPGALRGMGHSAVPMILSVIGTVGTENSMDLLGISTAPGIGFSVYFLSGVMDLNYCNAGGLLLLCPKKGTHTGQYGWRNIVRSLNICCIMQISIIERHG